jgi:uncharacterized membrane protein
LTISKGAPPASAATPGRFAWVALGLVILGYAGLSYYSNSNPDAKGLAAALSIGPVLLVGTVLLWRWTRPSIALPIAALVVAGLYYYWGLIERNYEWADLVQQCGAYTLVAVSFARTLLPGHIPLCTQLAVKLHGALSPLETAFTRRATLAWAVFYMVMSAAIVALFFTVSRSTWSLFVNFGTFGLIAIACLADAAIRHTMLPRRPGGGLLALLRQAFIG